MLTRSMVQIIQNERSNIANMANATFTEFRPISYRAQVVSGMVYYAKGSVIAVGLPRSNH